MVRFATGGGTSASTEQTLTQVTIEIITVSVSGTWNAVSLAGVKYFRARTKSGQLTLKYSEASPELQLSFGESYDSPQGFLLSGISEILVTSTKADTIILEKWA